MNEQQALARMIPPGKVRPGKPRGGVIQIWLTRACDKACFGCTQGSNLAGKPGMISVEQFESACKSLNGYFGTIGIFGGNPALHPQFDEICDVARRYFPKDKLGLWCNHPKGKGAAMRRTFNPATSNLNVHLDQEAFDEFKRDWPESRPFGLTNDSRHSPVYTAMKDLIKKLCPQCSGFKAVDRLTGKVFNSSNDTVTCPTCEGSGQVYDEAEAWELISNCDINQHWSAMIGVFRGELRGYFCEIAGAMAMLHQHEPDYPDTGVKIDRDGLTRLKRPQCWTHLHWWRLPMEDFREQVLKHCHECGVPLRGRGELAVTNPDGVEQVTTTHANVFKPKKRDRNVQLVQLRTELGSSVVKTTDYLGNARK